jgi:hypothetical protein
MLGAPAVLLAVLVRLCLARLAQPILGTDVLFHRWYTEAIRANGHRVPRRHRSVLGPGENTYPALLHVVLSWLPRATARRLEGQWFLVLFDAIPALLLAWQLVEHTTLDPNLAVALAGLYVVSPQITFLGLGPRAWALTPRIASQSLYAVLVVVAIAGGQVPSISAVALLTMLTCLLLLTSKFALQVVAFTAPVLAAWTGSWLPLAVLAGGAAMATLVSLGFFVRQVRAQAEHLHWYVRRSARYLYKRQAWTELARALARLDLVKAVKLVVWRNPLTAGLVLHLPLLAAVTWGAIDGVSGAVDVALGFCVAGIVAWFITSFGALRVLGEPERYLEFAFPAGWYLLWVLSVQHDVVAWVLPLLAAHAVGLSLVNWLAMRGYPDQHRAQHRQELVAAVRSHGGGTVLAMDLTDTFAFLDEPKVSLATYTGQETLLGEAGAFMDRYIWRYPWYASDSVAELARTYEVEFVVVNKVARELVERQSQSEYALGGFAPLHENATYVLYRRDRA